MVEVMRKLWTGEWVEHHGEFYDFERLEMTPAPTERIPFMWAVFRSLLFVVPHGLVMAG